MALKPLNGNFSPVIFVVILWIAVVSAIFDITYSPAQLIFCITLKTKKNKFCINWLNIVAEIAIEAFIESSLFLYSCVCACGLFVINFQLESGRAEEEQPRHNVNEMRYGRCVGRVFPLIGESITDRSNEINLPIDTGQFALYRQQIKALFFSHLPSKTLFRPLKLASIRTEMRHAILNKWQRMEWWGGGMETTSIWQGLDYRSSGPDPTRSTVFRYRIWCILCSPRKSSGTYVWGDFLIRKFSISLAHIFETTKKGRSSMKWREKEIWGMENVLRIWRIRLMYVEWKLMGRGIRYVWMWRDGAMRKRSEKYGIDFFRLLGLLTNS